MKEARVRHNGGFLIQWQDDTHFCPDIMRWEVLGRADTVRGAVVLAFFWLIRMWPVRGKR